MVVDCLEIRTTMDLVYIIELFYYWFTTSLSCSTTGLQHHRTVLLLVYNIIELFYYWFTTSLSCSTTGLQHH